MSDTKLEIKWKYLLNILTLPFSLGRNMKKKLMKISFCVKNIFLQIIAFEILLKKITSEKKFTFEIPLKTNFFWKKV